jgi:hypothetical protein
MRAILGLALAVIAVGPTPANGQASMATARAAASLVPGAPSAGGASAGLTVGGSAVRVGETGPTAHANPGGSVASITAAEAAGLVRSQQGRATVVILYGTNCPRSQAMFPGFVALAAHHASRNVAFVAFAADQGPRDVPPFLARYGAPFQAYHISRWAPGEMSRDMATIGLQIPPSWNLPHVAVLDGSGRVVGEWDGAGDLRAIHEALLQVP